MERIDLRLILKSAACVLMALLMTAAAAGCAAQPQKSDYGVFLSIEGDLDRLSGYKTVVIDAQYFSKEQINSLKGEGKTVYSYLNIGSLEDFRDYFDAYGDLILGAYENWEEEYWVDAADERWRAFITGELAPELLEKGIDGFFVDNCDVYYNYPTQRMLNGLAEIMRALVGTGKAVLINGGDMFLDAYCDGGGRWDDVITGINQESVFSAILWDEGGFGKASAEDREYFKDYVERYAAIGAEVYLLEYTRDKALIAEIENYCRQKGFGWYISDSLELD